MFMWCYFLHKFCPPCRSNPPVEQIPEVMTLRHEIVALESTANALPKAFNPEMRTLQLNNSLYATRGIKPVSDPNGVTLKPYKK